MDGHTLSRSSSGSFHTILNTHLSLLAITAAGAAMALSEVPVKRPVAGVRVAMLPDGALIVNPTVEQMEGSRLDLVMAGTTEAVLMIEGFCDFLTEAQMLEVRF